MDNFKHLFGKYVYILSVVSLFGGAGLFSYLSSLGLEIACEDIICEAGETCSINCEVYNPKYTSEYIYNYDNWPITFSPGVDDMNMYVKYYGKWRYTNFTMDTRLSNVPDDAKYVFVFPARTKKEFLINVTSKETKVIKWNFGALDPYIVVYDYVYENLSKRVPVYEDTIVSIAEKYVSENKTTIPSYDITEKVLKEYKEEFYQGDRIGIKIGKDVHMGPVNVYGDKLVKWKVPIGDRNLEEFGTCRDFEKEKGVCTEENMYQLVGLVK